MNELETWKARLNSLRPLLQKGSINEALAEHLKQTLNQVITFISSPIFTTGFPKIQRVTINKNLPGNNNERIKDIKYLKYPPADAVTKNGRANYIGQSMLYATFDPMTALSEMKPRIGDRITTSTWILPDHIDLVITPIFMMTSGNGGESHNALSLRYLSEYDRALREHPENIQLLIEELIIFVTECFAKEVEYGNSHDYILSAWFANKLLYEFEDGRIDAIVYPSVQQRLGMSNIVIKPEVFDAKYELFEVQESIIVVEPRMNAKGYFLQGTNNTKKFDLDSGKIFWQEKDTTAF
jgi:hypothetical protein